MAKAKKKKTKPKSEQSERFIRAATEAGVDKSGRDFERALDKLLPTPKKG